MKWHMRTFFSLLCSVLLLLSCEKSFESDYSCNDKQEKSEENIKILESIKINEAPKHAKTPSEAITHQFEVVFEDGSSRLATENDIISETIIGNQGILTIHSPEGNDRYASFLYHMEDEWILDAILRVSATENLTFKEKEGVYLPMEEFNFLKMNVEVNSHNQELWVFVDLENVITITRLDRYSFVENREVRKVILNNGAEAFMSKDDYENYFLYYYDIEKIIIIAGNIKERDELINIANSLPSVTDPVFPATTK
ncbi:MAG TPA: hypothetical protein DCY20_05465 [Firmicutes bacterium]|nr:hypothetical protein [Bacillota bacterium]